MIHKSCKVSVSRVVRYSNDTAVSNVINEDIIKSYQDVEHKTYFARKPAVPYSRATGGFRYDAQLEVISEKSILERPVAHKIIRQHQLRHTDQCTETNGLSSGLPFTIVM